MLIWGSTGICFNNFQPKFLRLSFLYYILFPENAVLSKICRITAIFIVKCTIDKVDIINFYFYMI